jgi:capsid portal protein
MEIVSNWAIRNGSGLTEITYINGRHIEASMVLTISM